jgi:hypothetical protein
MNVHGPYWNQRLLVPRRFKASRDRRVENNTNRHGHAQ